MRTRRQSPPSALQDENQPAPPDLHQEVVPGSKEEDVPVVKWKARMPVSPTGGTEEKEEVPRVSWNAQSPGSRPARGGVRIKPPVSGVAGKEEEEVERIPRVSWKRPVQVPSDDDIPRVKWSPRQVAVEPEAEEETVHSQHPPPGVVDEQVPRVCWKDRQAASPPPRDSVEEDEYVPKINWRSSARVPAQNSPNQGDRQEEIPKVSWRAPVVPASHEEVEEDVPVVRWKPQTVHSGSPKAAHASPRGGKHRNVPVKAIVTYRGRRLDEDQLSQESYGSGSDLERGEVEGVPNGGDSDLSLEDEPSRSTQRVSRYQAHYSNLQRPSGVVQSPQYGGGSSSRRPRQVGSISPLGSPTLTSRSPSPSLRHSPQYQSTIRSRSPSPSVVHGGQQASSLVRHSPQAARRQVLQPKATSHLSPRSLSPASRPGISVRAQTGKPVNNGSPVLGRRKITSPTGLQPQLTPPAPIATSRHPSGLPHHPASPGNRGKPARSSLQSPKTRSRDSSPRVAAGRSTLTPPNGGRRAQQQQGKPGRRVIRSSVTSPSRGGVRGQGTAPQNRSVFVCLLMYTGSPRCSIPTNILFQYLAVYRLLLFDCSRDGVKLVT